jgi:hypothetical protein
MPFLPYTCRLQNYIEIEGICHLIKQSSNLDNYIEIELQVIEEIVLTLFLSLFFLSKILLFVFS